MILGGGTATEEHLKNAVMKMFNANSDGAGKHGKKQCGSKDERDRVVI